MIIRDALHSKILHINFWFAVYQRWFALFGISTVQSLCYGFLVEYSAKVLKITKLRLPSAGQLWRKKDGDLI